MSFFCKIIFKIFNVNSLKHETILGLFFSVVMFDVNEVYLLYVCIKTNESYGRTKQFS
jgi:hypothetical protein